MPSSWRIQVETGSSMGKESCNLIEVVEAPNFQGARYEYSATRDYSALLEQAGTGT
jgi:hypothetical protein